jgi:hypothetical protein
MAKSHSRAWRSTSYVFNSRFTETDDLVDADRALPYKAGEVYYLTHISKHKWYRLEKQTPSQTLFFVMYGTKIGEHRRYKCLFSSRKE